MSVQNQPKLWLASTLSISSGQECKTKKTGQTVLKTSKNTHQKNPSSIWNECKLPDFLMHRQHEIGQVA